jgi:Predicted membrane protein
MVKLFTSIIKNRNFDAFIILILVALNILLKSICLTTYNIDLDEPFTLFHSQQTLKELFTIFSWENNPPLFFIIMHFWIKMFGIGVVSARFLPMLFSSLAVIFVYKIGIRFINRQTAIFSSLLYTCSNIIIMEAHDARVYSLLVMLTLASMYYFLMVIKSEKKHTYWIIFTLTNILLVYSHFLSFFVLISETVYVFALKEVRRKIWKNYLISSFTLFISFLPYLYLFLHRSTQAISTGINTPKMNKWHLLYSLFITSNFPLLTLNFFLIILIFVVYYYIKKVELSLYEKIISGWFFLSYIIIMIVSLKVPIITIHKYLIFIVPSFFLSLGLAVNYLFIRYKGIGIIVMGICVFFMTFTLDINYSYNYEASKSVSLIKHNKSESTVVFIVPFYVDPIFMYHYDINIFKDYKNYKTRLKQENIFVINSPTDIDTSLIEKYNEVLLFEGWGLLPVIDPENIILNKLSEKFNSNYNLINLNGYTIYQFKTNIQKSLAH